MKSRARGFTLIELMVSVAIIGVLSSVAIPTLQSMTYRARFAERATMAAAINGAVNDYWVRNGRFPNPSGTGSTLNLPSNPGFPLTSSKRSMSLALGHWPLLSLNTEGGVYFSYWGLINAGDLTAGGPGRRRHLIWGDRDLDGAGVQPFTTDVWTYVNEMLVSHALSDTAGPNDW